MIDFVIPVVFVTLVWFFSTGAILWLNRLPRETHPGSITAATPLAAAAVCGLIISSSETSPAAVYLAFASAIVIWGWHEMSFLMGFVNGPRRTSCPDGVRGWRRFVVSTEAVIYHELAIAITLVGMIALQWGQPNQMAVCTFALLFLMRLSAKLNIFLGVANLSDDMMPAHLDYLKSYFRKRAMNWLYPLTMAGSLWLLVWLFEVAAQASPGSGAEAQAMLLLALTALAILEHIFMMLPLRDSALWRWAVPPDMVISKPDNGGRQ